MARCKKPASLRTGKNINKSEREELNQMEEKLKGDNDFVYEVPDHLDDMAKMFYEFIIDELKSTDILTNIDAPLVEQTADCLSKIRMCDEEINKNGLFVEEMDRYGHKRTVENVAVKTKMNLLTKYKTFTDLLGMSPSSRAVIASKKVEAKENAEDPLLQILRGEVPS